MSGASGTEGVRRSQVHMPAPSLTSLEPQADSVYKVCKVEIVTTLATLELCDGQGKRSV